MSLNYAQMSFLLLHLTLVVTQDSAEGQYVEQVQEEGGAEATWCYPAKLVYLSRTTA